MNTIKQTLSDLFELEKMPPEKAAEMADRLGKLVFQAVLVRALPMLSDKDSEEYDRIVATPDGGIMLFKFLGEKVPGFENMIMEEAEALRAELAGEFKEAGI